MIVHHSHNFFLIFNLIMYKNYILKGKRMKQMMIAMTIIADNDDDN